MALKNKRSDEGKTGGRQETRTRNEEGTCRSATTTFPGIYIRNRERLAEKLNDVFFTRTTILGMISSKEGYVYDARSQITIERIAKDNIYRNTGTRIIQFPKWIKGHLGPCAHTSYNSYVEFDKDKYKVCVFDTEQNSPLLLDLSSKSQVSDAKEGQIGAFTNASKRIMSEHCSSLSGDGIHAEEVFTGSHISASKMDAKCGDTSARNEECEEVVTVFSSVTEDYESKTISVESNGNVIKSDNSVHSMDSTSQAHASSISEDESAAKYLQAAMSQSWEITGEIDILQAAVSESAIALAEPSLEDSSDKITEMNDQKEKAVAESASTVNKESSRHLVRETPIEKFKKQARLAKCKVLMMDVPEKHNILKDGISDVRHQSGKKHKDPNDLSDKMLEKHDNNSSEADESIKDVVKDPDNDWQIG